MAIQARPERAGDRVGGARQDASSVKEDLPVKSEVKLAVLLVFFVFLIVALLLGEHLSKARTQVQDTSLGVVAPGVSLAGSEQGLGGMSDGAGGRAGSMGGSMDFGGPFEGRGLGLSMPTQPAAELTRVGGGSGSSSGSSATGQAFGGGVAPAGGSPGRALPVDLTNANPGANGNSNGQGGLGGEPSMMSDSPSAGTSVGAHDPSTDGKHPVRRGETLVIIAKRYYADGALARALAIYNRSKLNLDGGLQIGVTLRIPPKSVLLAGGGAAEPEATPGPIPGRSDAPARRDGGRPSVAGNAGGPGGTTPPGTLAPEVGTTYTVKAGDTPMAIARKTLGTAQRWRDIMKANPGLDENRLKIGQTLKVPKKTEARPTSEPAARGR